MEAILVLYEADNVIWYDACPSEVDKDDWAQVHRRAKAYLCLYIEPHIYSNIASEVEYPTFKEKWNVLQHLYGGAAGSTAIFNTWIELIQARLDDSEPLATQLAKLNETRVTLANANMGVTDLQYSLILLNTLLASYKVVTTTILANASPLSLDYRKITARILNEEGRRTGASGSSLNAAHAAPIKAKDKGKGRDHSNLTCHYCQKKGHIKPDCCKRKKDEAEQKKKEGNASVSRQYDFIFSFMPTFFFLVYFTLSHVTLLSHGLHVQSHDQSHDHGLFSYFTHESL